MDDFTILVLAWIALAVALFPVQLRIRAPYGRHLRPGWGPAVSNRFGWMAMEVVPLLVFVPLFVGGTAEKTAAMWVFFAAWVGHYAYRGLIFPFRLRTAGKRIPVLIVVSGALFNAVNAALNGFYLGTLSPPYPVAWLVDPRFTVGVILFVGGAATNVWADNRLIALRGPGAPDYAIPRGGLFALVTCPNHLGEIVEWCGFALMCWTLPALSFAIWTAANLVPRSLGHHRWYRQRFPDYPPDRHAVVPYLL
jgi:3-oxo-5-alpha-steroid 4-dehydrogenase 1